MFLYRYQKIQEFTILYFLFNFTSIFLNQFIILNSNTEEMGCAYGTTKQTQVSMKVNSPNQKDSRIAPKIRTIKKLQKINGRQQIDKQKLFENVLMVQDILPNKQDQYIISNILKSHFLFYKLNQLEKDQIVKKMAVYSAQVGTYIFKQGDPASAFFIIAQGSVQVQINGQKKRILKRGDYFGELALIYMAPRSASILVKTPVKLWCITRCIFRNSVQTLVKSSYGTAKNYIDKFAIFNFLTQSQKNSIAFSMLSLKYLTGQIIFKEKDDANSFFIVTKGKVQISIKGKNNLILGIGESFGQQSFLEQQFRGGTAIAKQQTVCLSIGRQSIKNILGDKIINIVYYNIHKWALKRSKLISTKLSNVQLQKLLQTRRSFKFCKNGEIIFKKNEIPDKFVICLQGKLNGKEGAYLIGEQFINSHGILKINQDWIKQEDGLISIIKYQQIQAIIEKKICQLSKRKETKYERKMQQVQEKSSMKDYSQLKIENFIHIKKLGEGQFGKVYLIKQSITGTQYYALKCIQKQQVIESKMEKIILEERNILKAVNSPFLIKFIKSFKDNYFVYFLTEYIKGSQLFDVIRQIGLLTKNIARFYISSLILSIQYLHLKNIIYRDLKPENVMVENNGYLKLIDMGTAKLLKHYNGFRTFTIIGTPHYMAPQVMQGKGYSFAVDIWSLGIVLYQFLCGQLPFGQDLEDPYQIHSQVIRSQLIYPSFFNDTKAKKLIQQMLHKIPQLRLPKGFASLKANSYFDDFDWQALYQKQLKCPYIPKKGKNSQKALNEGTLFLNTIARQKSKLQQPRQSYLINWDADF